MILFKDVSFKFAQNTLLENISFHVKEKDFVLLTGPNGVGKTTLFYLLLGIYRSYKGEISIDGKDVKQSFNDISYIPQRDHFGEFSMKVVDVVADSLVGPRTFFFKSLKEHRKKAQEALDKLDLLHLASQNFNELSGGEAQKVLFARMIMQSKKILLLDEPIANIDPLSKNYIYNILEEFNKEATIMMISHDMSLFSRHRGKFMHLNNKTIESFTGLEEMDHAFFHLKEEK